MPFLIHLMSYYPIWPVLSGRKCIASPLNVQLEPGGARHVHHQRADEGDHSEDDLI